MKLINRSSALVPAGVAVLLFAGCNRVHGPRPAQLAGESPEQVMLTTQDGFRYGVHDVQLHEEADGTVVTGHIGPASRAPHRPRGHVDVKVFSPAGEEIATASGALQAMNTSPRVPVESNFQVQLPGHVEPGCEVRVAYHASVDEHE